MLTFAEYVTETLDAPYPLRWSSTSDDTVFWADFTTGARPYKIRFRKSASGSDWELNFSLQDWVEWTNDAGQKFTDSSTGITGTGNANRVFATVVKSIQEFLRKVDPITLFCTASEPSRQKLYRRMMSLVMKQNPKYKAREAQQGVFELWRRDAVGE